MATEIPASITMPDTVETRLGTLRFFDGFPDDATVAKAFDNLDFQRAVQAYLQGLPAVTLLGMRAGLRQWGPVNQTVAIAENLLDSRTLLLGGNANTVYWYAPLDMTSGPLVLEAPPEVLGLINDCWSRWVVDLGINGPDQGQGGKYLVLPPGYNDPVPDGYVVVRPRTFNLFAFFRTFLVDGDPRPGVERGKAHLRIYPLVQASTATAQPPHLRFVNISGKAFNTVGPSDSTAFAYINQVIQEEPVEAIDANTLGLFASIGIQKGQPFNPDARMQAILAEASRVGDATARALAYRYRDPSAYYYPNSAWRMLYHAGYRLEQEGARLWDSYISVFFYGWGPSPAMDGKMVGKGSQYALAYVDAHGEPFDGSKSYRAALATAHPGGGFLVGDALRHPDPLDAANRSTGPDCQ